MIKLLKYPQAIQMLNLKSSKNILLILTGLIAIRALGCNSQYAVWRHNLNMQSKHNLLKAIMDLNLNLDAPDAQAEQKSKVQSRELKDNQIMSQIGTDGQQNNDGGISKEASTTSLTALASGSHPVEVSAPNTTQTTQGLGIGLGLASWRGGRAKLSAEMIRVLELLKSEMVVKEIDTRADQSSLIVLDR